MFGGGMIELAIGLIFIFFLFSLLVSGVNELAEQFLRRRAKYLESAVLDLLGGSARSFYDHPLIQSLHSEKGAPKKIPPADAPPTPAGPATPQADQPPPSDNPKSPPSYIPSRTFSLALLSLLTEATTTLASEIQGHEAGASIQMSVSSSLGFPPPPGFHVRVDSEVFEVQAVDGTTWTATGGAGGTTADAHGAGATVTRVYTKPPSQKALVADVLHGLDGLPDGQLKDTLRAFVNDADRSLDRWRKAVEAWFDDKMDRVSGWYKRKTKWLLLIWGIVIVTSFNADTIVFARTLYRDSTLRSSIAQAAQNFVQTTPTIAPSPGQTPLCPVTPSPLPSGETAPPAGSLPCVADEVKAIKDLGLPLGWSSKDPGWPHGTTGILLKILGLLTTAGALTLGAPFWFDLLNKFINFRSSGSPPPSTSAPPPGSSTGGNP